MSREAQKKLLVALLAVFGVLLAYRLVTAGKPVLAPLVYTRGVVATSPVRSGVLSAAKTDPLQVLIARRNQKFPGAKRDLFRMDNPSPKPKPKPLLAERPTPTAPSPPPAPEKTPGEIAAEQARADMSGFRFLGYLTDKDRSLFLAKDGETFISRSGDIVVKSYKIKDAGRDYVVLLDTVTQAEVRVELSGGAATQTRAR